MVNKSSDKKQLEELVRSSIKRTRSLFKDDHENPLLEDEERYFYYIYIFII